MTIGVGRPLKIARRRGTFTASTRLRTPVRFDQRPLRWRGVDDAPAGLNNDSQGVLGHRSSFDDAHHTLRVLDELGIELLASFWNGNPHSLDRW